MGAVTLERLTIGVTIAACLAGACSTDRGGRPSCPREQPAFRVQLTAGAGALPADTTLTVFYQGNQSESFALSSPAAGNEDVCCRAGARTPGALPAVPCHSAPAADGGAAEAVLCELWTNGVAEVRVTASGYPRFSDVLEARPREDDCGLETVDVRLVLEQADGGVID